MALRERVRVTLRDNTRATHDFLRGSHVGKNHRPLGSVVRQPLFLELRPKKPRCTRVLLHSIAFLLQAMARPRNKEEKKKHAEEEKARRKRIKEEAAAATERARQAELERQEKAERERQEAAERKAEDNKKAAIRMSKHRARKKKGLLVQRAAIMSNEDYYNNDYDEPPPPVESPEQSPFRPGRHQRRNTTTPGFGHHQNRSNTGPRRGLLHDEHWAPTAPRSDRHGHQHQYVRLEHGSPSEPFQ